MGSQEKLKYILVNCIVVNQNHVYKIDSVVMGLTV